MQQLPPKSVHPSNRAIAEENELGALKLVHLYGHTRRTEIARALWPTASAHMSEKMALRTIGRLTGRKELIERDNILGGLSLVLGKGGAARLRDWGINARAGGDMSSITGTQFRHRMLGTCYLIERQIQGHSSWGEHAIGSGQAPVSRHELERRWHKLPDGLVLVPAVERGYADGLVADWIEVEGSSRKPDRELRRILALAWEAGAWLDDAHTAMLDRVVFVYDRRHSHETRITTALQQYMLARPPAEPSLLLSSIVAARCQIRNPLVWCGYEEVDGNTLLGSGRLRADVTK
jgi:hypothetical protein